MRFNFLCYPLYFAVMRAGTFTHCVALVPVVCSCLHRSTLPCLINLLRVLSHSFLRLWIAVLVIYPTNQAVIALTFANYVLQPLFPTCLPPENGLRLLAAVCLRESYNKTED